MSNIVTYRLLGCPVVPPMTASIILDLAGFTGEVPGPGTNYYEVDSFTPTFGDVLVYSTVGPTLLATIPLDGDRHDITEIAQGVGESVELFFVVRGDWKSGGNLRLLSTDAAIVSSTGAVSLGWEPTIGELDPEVRWISCVVPDPFAVVPMDSCGTLIVGDTSSDGCVISLILNLPDPPSPTYPVFLGTGGRFADAALITLPYHSSVESLVDCGSEVDEPDPAGVFPAPTRWYQFTAPSTGTLSVSTLGSTVLDRDTVVALYTGATLGSLVSVGFNDDLDIDGGQYLSYLEVGVMEGVVYHVQLTAYPESNFTDPFDLVVEMV